MKSVIFAAILLASVHGLTDEQKQKLKLIHAECAIISRVNPELILKARGGEFVNDPNLKTHLFCVSKRIGLQNDAGDISEDVIRQKLLPEVNNVEVVNKLIQKCAVKKATADDTAFDALKCFYESSPKRILLA